MAEISIGEMILRLVLACMLGGAIGYERQARRKSAGLRTNLLVCLGSCLIMILSQELYLEVEGHTNADPARLAAQVVSGIGFLGAGAIMKEGVNVTGLTTAACLWVVAGVGLAVGAGAYIGALLTTALVVLTLGALSRLDEWVVHESHIDLHIYTVDRPGQLLAISTALDDLGLKVRDVKIHEDETGRRDDDGNKYITMELDIYNKMVVKSIVIADAIRKIEGVRRVAVS